LSKSLLHDDDDHDGDGHHHHDDGDDHHGCHSIFSFDNEYSFTGISTTNYNPASYQHLHFNNLNNNLSAKSLGKSIVLIPQTSSATSNSITSFLSGIDLHLHSFELSSSNHIIQIIAPIVMASVKTSVLMQHNNSNTSSSTKPTVKVISSSVKTSPVFFSSPNE